MFNIVQHSAAGFAARFIQRVVHRQYDTVDEDYKHANPLKPGEEKLKKIGEN